MKKFFVTFRFGSPFTYHFAEIYVTPDESKKTPTIDLHATLAHKTAQEHFGDAFAMVYDINELAAQVEKFGLKRLCGIWATDFGSSIEYKLL